MKHFYLEISYTRSLPTTLWPQLNNQVTPLCVSCLCIVDEKKHLICYLGMRKKTSVIWTCKWVNVFFKPTEAICCSNAMRNVPKIMFPFSFQKHLYHFVIEMVKLISINNNDPSLFSAFNIGKWKFNLYMVLSIWQYISSGLF